MRSSSLLRLEENRLMSCLLRFFEEHARMFVLTGAGISTGSGIPDYRDRFGHWKRRPPVMLQDFIRDASIRRRYWARSMIGWPVIANARPNAAHDALTRLQAIALVHRLVTQNVDGLHQRAGSAGVVELHGSIAVVVCVECHAEMSRQRVQQMLEDANPDHARLGAATAPDGDADFESNDLDAFEIPDCPWCGGILRPNVVFFGDSVPKDRVTATMEALEQSEAMLVVGSSLMTYSGYRFCEYARQMNKPIAAINVGRTRADHLFQMKVEQPCADTLASLLHMLHPATK